MSVTSLGMRLDEHDPVRLWVSRAEGWACLQIDTGGTHCEILLGAVQVEALREQLPAVHRALAQCAAEDDSCANAMRVSQQASDLVVLAVGAAAEADAAGAHDVAQSLLSAASNTMAKADAVDAAVLAFEAATADADDATESLTDALRRKAVTPARTNTG
jgi:hypothetical protein